MDKECLILVDPAYINSRNQFYIDAKINIYEYIHDNNATIYPSMIFLFFRIFELLNYFLKLGQSYQFTIKLIRTEKRKQLI